MPEIGRISGPLLKENLTRDGVNLRFESNLIYLDVNTHAADVTAQPGLPTSWTGNVGIRNPNPAYPLDVVGTTRSNQLLIKPNVHYDAYAEIDNVNINGNTIQSTVGNLVLQAPTGTDRIQINSDTKISANLEVTGNITLGGTINIGDSADDDVVFDGEIKSNIIPDAAATYDLGSAAKAWRAGYFDDVVVDGLSVGNISVTGSFINDQIEIVGNRIATFRSNADLELDTAGTGTIELLTDTNVTGDLTVSGDVEIQGGDLTTNQLTFNLLNTTATTVNFAGAATTLEIGAATGTTNINNNLDVDGDVQVKGGDITTDQTTFNLLNTTATTLNIGGASTATAIGSTVSGTTTINYDATVKHDLTVDGDVQVKGGDITTDQTIFNLLNTTATTINFAGAGTAVNIGAATGTTTVRNDLKIDGSVDVTGDVSIGGNLTLGNTTFDTITVVADFTSNLVPDASLTYDLGSASKSWNNLYVENINISGNMYFDQIAIEGNKISTTQSNADLEFDTAGTGRYVFIGTGGVIMPVGTTAERPAPPQQGMLRFNTDDARFENYNGEEWNRMIHDDDAIAFAIALG